MGNPPHFRSPSTFQPWLRLSLDLSVLLVISIRYTLFRPVCVAVGLGGSARQNEIPSERKPLSI